MSFVLGLLLVLSAVAVLIGLRASRSKAERESLAEPFFIKPYLQPGANPRNGARYSMEVCWHSFRHDQNWSVQYRVLADQTSDWLSAIVPARTALMLHHVPASYRYVACLTGMPGGARFEYRVNLDGKTVFQAQGKTLPGAGSDYRAVLFADMAEGGEACKQIAAAAYLQKPDLIVMPGDLVYKRGRVSEYLERFFPVYNCDQASPSSGAPILRSVPILTAAGNHDMAMQNVTDVPDFDQHADLFAYFMLLSQPLNGPIGSSSHTQVPRTRGSDERKDAMLKAAGERFPRMANFSVDAGDTHWLILDANAYMDWTAPYLRAWVENDLASSKARWKFVCFHQPSFTTDVKHADEQQMRLLAGVFEKYGVDVVFSGHNHTYERTYPLRFAVVANADGSQIDASGRVNGTFELDRQFDGSVNTRPQGVVYLVTGGGGAKLYLTPDRRANQNALPPYTYKLVDDRHSFTVCDVQHDKLTFRQLTADGTEIDKFIITK